MNREYFKIMGEASGKMLDASMSNIGEVVLWESNGQDNQLWYWDGPSRDALRNKQFPDRVLDFNFDDYRGKQWGEVYLTTDFHNGWNQRWQVDRGEIVCKGFARQTVPNLRLDVFAGKSDNGAKVGVYQKNGGHNQRWRIQALNCSTSTTAFLDTILTCLDVLSGSGGQHVQPTACFKIVGDSSGRVLDASMSNIGEVCLWDANGQDNQLWYWDGPNRDVLRNKQFPDRVLDFNFDDYQRSQWGKVYLTTDFHHGWNQRWKVDGREVVCKGFARQTVPGLRLDVFGGESHNGAKVGVYQRQGSPNQRWRFQSMSGARRY